MKIFTRNNHSTWLPMGALAACLATIWLSACNQTEPTPNPEHTFPVTFDLSDYIPDVPLDSLFIEIKIGDGEFHPLLVDLSKSETQTPIAAKPGDSIFIRFEMYSGNTRVGQGSLKGSLEAGTTTALEPTFDSSAITQVKRRLAEGLYLPTNLAERYALAIENKPLTLTVSPVDGIHFLWSITPEGSDIVTDTTSEFTWTPQAGTGGKTAAIKVEAFKNETRVESRHWNAKILSGSSQGRLLKYTVRSDSTASYGTSTRISQGDSLVLRFTYNSLDPTPRDSAVQTDSVFIDNEKRPVLVRIARAGGETIDSGYSWSSEGNLLALSVRQGSSVRIDSFSYDEDRLVSTRHFLNDSLTEKLVHHREGAQGMDTLFVRNESGDFVVSRIFQSRFLGDQLAEKIWLIQRTSAQAYRRELFVYTGLGALLRYRVYTEGETSELQSSQTWTYNGTGLALRAVEKDEVLNRTISVIDFTWEAANAQPKMAATSGRFASVTNPKSIQSSAMQDLNTMSAIRLGRDSQ